jgi:DNA-binding beta-propeller fold protein YncE
MALELVRYVDLPEHAGRGGFDHGAVHRRRRRLYVAHTANDALDVIDCKAQVYLHSIPGLTGVAGALVADDRDLIFTSNRGENTVGIFSPSNEAALVRVAVGIRPNGLAFDPADGLLLVAHVGDPALPGSHTVSIVDVVTHTRIADVAVGGRTRWAVFDRETGDFLVNIADPPQIAVVEASATARVAKVYPIPAAGPHGLALDPATGRLWCACDGKALVCLDARSGEIRSTHDLSGVPDVVVFNPNPGHVYVAIGDPGVVEVFQAWPLRRLETVLTEPGAHTIALDEAHNTVYAFLPQTHRAAVLTDHW